MIPLFVDCSRRRIVIFGGGDVAARKAAYFAGVAEVTVISRSFVPAFDKLKITKKELDLDKTDGREFAVLLTGAFLVIAAVSSSDINNRIGRLCRATGILFNNANGETGDVILPAVSHKENFTIAISTGGNSPATSRFIREHLEQEFPALDQMIALENRLREVLKAREPDQKKRTAILTNVMHDKAVWAALESGGSDAWEDICMRYLHD